MTDFYEPARQFRDTTRELGRAHGVKVNAAYAEYSEATNEAAKRRDEANRPNNEAYEAEVAANLAAYGERERQLKDELAQEELACAEKAVDETVPNRKVFTWMLSDGVWYDYSSECTQVLEYLETEKPTTLAQVNEFGRKSHRWCTQYTTLLLKAVEAGVIELEHTHLELATIKVRTAMEEVGLYENPRVKIGAALKTAAEGFGVDDENLLALFEAIGK
jgi:hypothetical protein